mmetsp:Transcript_33872/g.82097  ORF Transcript_33872/g.82097 Transcript_33872/m.82097 type:complete len:215 (-) Transcript_33872:861-1505(-)
MLFLAEEKAEEEDVGDRASLASREVQVGKGGGRPAPGSSCRRSGSWHRVRCRRTEPSRQQTSLPPRFQSSHRHCHSLPQLYIAPVLSPCGSRRSLQPLAGVLLPARLPLASRSHRRCWQRAAESPGEDGEQGCSRRAAGRRTLPSSSPSSFPCPLSGERWRTKALTQPTLRRNMTAGRRLWSSGLHRRHDFLPPLPQFPTGRKRAVERRQGRPG